MMNITVNLQNHRITSDLVSNPDLSCCDVSVGEKRKRNENDESCVVENCGVVRGGFNDSGNGGEESGIHEVDGSKEQLPKFNDFDKLREEVNFEVGQTWAVYDTVDGIPRLYAQIRKVAAPGFGVRITYLEPDPDNEKELQWFEQDLPVSVGKFRLGKNENTKDRCKFSHIIQCNEGIDRFENDFFTVSPRKAETWALFKDWDIKWSSVPDSHRKYEYEFVEVLSDYDDGAGLFVAFLRKAKGFASVFFRMGNGNDIFCILPHSLYRFSHRVPSIKPAGTEGKGLPKDAYELDQAAFPGNIEEIIVPSNESQRKPQAIYFASKGKVFQTGQIWSFYSGYDDLPLHYCMIQKITYTQADKQEPVYKLHIRRLKPSAFPEDVIRWREGLMPVSCGTYYARTVVEIITPDEASQQIMPEISMDGKEYTILPRIGEVWLIYRFWYKEMEVERLDYCSYDIVEILDDTSDYKVLVLKSASVYDDSDMQTKWFEPATQYTEDEDEDEDEEHGSEPIFTIPKSKRLRFSHKVPAWRITKEMHGELRNDVFKVDARALSINLLGH